MCRSHHLVDHAPCLQTRNLDETNRVGCVSLGCVVSCWVVVGVLWVGWGLVCCWQWPCQGSAGRLDVGLVVGKCGGTLADARPAAAISPSHSLQLAYPGRSCHMQWPSAQAPGPDAPGLQCSSPPLRRQRGMPRPAATAACWPATKLRLALALGQMSMRLGLLSFRIDPCLSTRFICKRDPPRS